MASKIKEIEGETLRLPLHQRAELAEHLILSLEEEEDLEAERLWIEEAERRYQEYKQGKVQAMPANKVFQDAHHYLISFGKWEKRDKGSTDIVNEIRKEERNVSR